ncbi:MAG TPA: hypothetical protein VNN62_03500 [Methylomirabilota bacterium]|nr:hypothetical protein [Methylomirabilota bacterium]
MTRENSSRNRVVAWIRRNTLERHPIGGLEANAGISAVSVSIGISNQNVLDTQIERNTVRNQTGQGFFGGGGDINGVANGNQTTARVIHNVVEGNLYRGIELATGDLGQASANTLDVRVAYNTICHTTDTTGAAGIYIFGESGYSGGNILFLVPNQGTGNVLTGEIFQHTDTTAPVQNGTPGNIAIVTQSKNDPCP